ncbi:MAG: DUF2155 domain-containing protein [Pseudomonadota bacterium]
MARGLGSAMKAGCLGGMLWVAMGVSAAAQSGDSVSGDVVVMRGLDKLTGRVETFEAPIGGVVTYERLRIEAKACNRRTENRAPDSTAFIQVFDTKYDEEVIAFSGWMFASSPALSAMDHSRYDVWVLSCKTS